MNISEQAADWFLTLRSEPNRQSEFGAWLRESPSQVKEFFLVPAAYRSLDALPAESVDMDGLRASISAGVLALPLGHTGRKQTSRRTPHRKTLIATALAAGI